MELLDDVKRSVGRWFKDNIRLADYERRFGRFFLEILLVVVIYFFLGLPYKVMNEKDFVNEYDLVNGACNEAGLKVKVEKVWNRTTLTPRLAFSCEEKKNEK